MQKRTLTGIVIMIMLMVSFFGTVAAQELDPVDVDDGSTEETTPESQTYTHPVVQLLADYFGRETAEEPVDDDAVSGEDETEGGETEEGDADEGGLDDGDPEAVEPEEEAPVDIGAEIEALHEDGMGFGVIVKIFAMAEKAAETCAALEPEEETGDAALDEDTSDDENGDVEAEVYDPCAVSVDSLVEQFKGGMGMGLLFKEHGKPELLGVGHVNQELKEWKENNDDSGDEVLDENGEDEGETLELQAQHPNGKPQETVKDKQEKLPKPDKQLPKGKGPKKP